MASMHVKGCLHCFLSYQIYIVILAVMSRSVYTEKLMVSRGGDRDYFGSDRPVNCDLCRKASANQASSHAELGSEYTCKCGCDWHGTFLIRDKKCYKKTDLPKDLFPADGLFVEDQIVDLSGAGSFKPRKNCNGCMITSIKYLFYNQWINVNSTYVSSYWDIKNTYTKKPHKIEWDAYSNYPVQLNGKILQIQLQGCTKTDTSNGWPNSSPQVFIKAKGKYFVDFSSMSKTISPTSMVIASSISTSSVVSPTATLHPIPSTQAVSTSSVVSPRATLHKSTISSTQAGTSSSVVVVVVTTTTAPIQSSSVPVEPTPVQSSNTPYHTQTVPGASTTPANNFSPTASKRKDEQSSPVGAIVGSVMAVIAIIVIIVIIIMCRRRKNTSGQNSKPQKGPKTPENPTYANGSEIFNLSKQKQAAQNTDNDFEYDYAAVDGDPRSSSNAAPGIYQSLTKDPNRESVYTPLDQSTAYDKVERPIFKPARKGPTDPLYNVLERSNGNDHDYMEPGVNIDKTPQNNEPVYNVLEGPGEDPDYNVLEDPNEQYEPEYNVLEGPGDNVPVDGHDNVGYASTIDIKSGGAPNGPIYAAPEGPISEPTYQPLNVNGPDENVYQPLDRKSRVVPDDQPLYHVLESTTSDA